MPHASSLRTPAQPNSRDNWRHHGLSIELLEPRNSSDVAAVAALHSAYLRDSPVVKLGETFMRRFYYVTLIKDQLVRCRMCRAEGRVVAFAAYTARPFDFMAIGMRKHLFTLAGLMLFSIVRRPALIADILSVFLLLRQLRSESREVPEPGTGELLSLVVLPEFQDAVLPGGTSRLAVRLIETVMNDLRHAGLKEIQFSVQPSNRAANILYSAMGCSFRKLERATGAVHRYTCRLDRQPAENFA